MRVLREKEYGTKVCYVFINDDAGHTKQVLAWYIGRQDGEDAANYYGQYQGR